jgi:hypothetical protein
MHPDCNNTAKIVIYSLPIIMTLNYFGESNLRSRFTTPSKMITTRLLYSLMSIATILIINDKLSKDHHNKMCAESREFLREWGHISPYHSSLRESDSSVEELISY